MFDLRSKSRIHARLFALSLSALVILTVLFTTRTHYAGTPISALNDVKRGKDYICNGDPQPPGYGIVAVATGFGNSANLCSAGGTTFYIEKFSDGLIVCGLDASLVGYLLYPIDYVVTGVSNQPQCPSSVGWAIEKLKRENTVCRLNNVIGPQVVVPPGYVVTGLTDSPVDSCPGPVVTIKQPGKTEVVCGYSQAVLANAFYLLPPGYSIVGTTNSASCPSDLGALGNAWNIERVFNPKKVGDELLASSCSLENTVRSLTFDTPTSIEFVNNSSQTVKIYWLDYFGTRTLYATLPAAASYVQQTFVTHPWLVATTNDSCLGIYFPTAAPSRVIIR